MEKCSIISFFHGKSCENQLETSNLEANNFFVPRLSMDKTVEENSFHEPTVVLAANEAKSSLDTLNVLGMSSEKINIDISADICGPEERLRYAHETPDNVDSSVSNFQEEPKYATTKENNPQSAGEILIFPPVSIGHGVTGLSTCGENRMKDNCFPRIEHVSPKLNLSPSVVTNMLHALPDTLGENVFMSTNANIQDALSFLCRDISTEGKDVISSMDCQNIDDGKNNKLRYSFLNESPFFLSRMENSGACKYLSPSGSFSPQTAAKNVVKKWRYSDARKMDGLLVSGAMTNLGVGTKKVREKPLHNQRKVQEEGNRPSKVKISDVKQIWFFSVNSEASDDKGKSPNSCVSDPNPKSDIGTHSCYRVLKSQHTRLSGNATEQMTNESNNDGFQPKTLRISSKPVGLPLSWLCDERDGEIECTPIFEDMGKRTSVIVAGGLLKTRKDSICSSPPDLSLSESTDRDVTDERYGLLLQPIRTTGIKSPRAPAATNSPEINTSTSSFSCRVFPIRKARAVNDKFLPITPPGEEYMANEMSGFDIHARTETPGFKIISTVNSEFEKSGFDEDEEEVDDGSIRPLSSGVKIPNEIPKYILDNWKEKTSASRPDVPIASVRVDQCEFISFSCSHSLSSSNSGPSSNSTQHANSVLSISTSSSTRSTEQKLRSLSFADRMAEIH